MERWMKTRIAVGGWPLVVGLVLSSQSGCGAAPPLGGGGGPKASVAPSGGGLGGPGSTGSGGTPAGPTEPPTSLDTGGAGSMEDTGCDTGLEGSVYYLDLDGDGYGGESVRACTSSLSRVERGGDCDEARSDVYPGAAEVGCGLDANCDGDFERCTYRLEEAENVLAMSLKNVLGDLDGNGTLEVMVGNGEFRSDGEFHLTYPVLSGGDLRGTIDASAHTLLEADFRSTEPVGDENFMVGEVDRVHDLNGDGYDELLLVNQERVLFGPLSDGIVLNTPQQINGLWSFMEGRGDLTGDGQGDMLTLVSAPDWSAPDGWIAGVGLLPGPFEAGTLDPYAEAVLIMTYKPSPQLHEDDPQFGDDDFGTFYEVVGDTDGDGVPEAVVADTYDERDVPNREGHIEDQFFLFRLDDRGVVTTDEAFASFHYYTVGIGDTDGDGYDDILTNGEACGEGRCVLHGPLVGPDWTTNRSTRFVDSVSPTGESTFVRATMSEVGDLNGDGRAEIAIASLTGSTSEFSVMAGGLPNGSYAIRDVRARITFTSDPESNFGGIAPISDDFASDRDQLTVDGPFREPTDLDGDGLDDLVFGTQVPGMTVYYGADLAL